MTNNKIFSLTPLMNMARQGKFAIGSFSPRYLCLIKPVLQAARNTRSPVIVQISQKEFDRFLITAREFADEFFIQMERLEITVPVCLHLDHTKDFEVIQEAIKAGFTSVMIDASDKDFDDNVRITKKTVDYAHSFGVSVEAELGRIGTTDFVETSEDEIHYTVPEEALRFAKLTGADALAVSVGTAHGLYIKREPKVDLERLKQIGSLTEIPLVLHGGSGVPPQMVKDSYKLTAGSICKVNIATDLEQCFLKSLGKQKSMLNRDIYSLNVKNVEVARENVRLLVENRMINYLDSAHKS